jgi:hypothetical protein
MEPGSGRAASRDLAAGGLGETPRTAFETAVALAPSFEPYCYSFYAYFFWLHAAGAYRAAGAFFFFRLSVSGYPR